MKHLQFSTSIHADPDKVWQALWEDSNYREWTSVFGEGSYAITDWKEGSEIKFLSSSGGGMQSTIAKIEPNKFISFRHEGELKNGELIPVNDAAREWIGAHENYTLVQTGETTDLMVELDVLEKEAAYFEENFPKSLEIVKKIAERQTLEI